MAEQGMPTQAGGVAFGEGQLGTVTEEGYPSIGQNGAPSAAPTSLATSTNAYEVSGPGTAMPLAGKSAGLQVQVRSPLKESAQGKLGMQDQYYTFLVITHTTLPQYSRGDFSVRRRFRDFVALSKLLSVQFRGYFIPPRPGKNQWNVVKSEKFVEARRKRLEMYMNRLAQHPQISRSQELRVFLEQDGDLRASQAWQELQPETVTWQAAASKLSRQITRKERVTSAQEASRPAMNNKDFVRGVREMVIGQRAIKPGTQLPSAETKLDEQRRTYREFGKQTRAVFQASKRTESRFEQWGIQMVETGLSFKELASFEGDNQVTEDEQAMFKVSEVLVDVGHYTRESSGQLEAIVDTLAYYMSHTPAIMRAMQERQQALVTLKTLEQDLQRKRQRLQDTESQGVDEKNAATIDSLRQDVQGLQAAVNSARQEYDLLTARNQEDIERLADQQSGELFEMVQQYTEVNAKYYRKVAEIFDTLAKELGCTPDELALQ